MTAPTQSPPAKEPTGLKEMLIFICILLLATAAGTVGSYLGEEWLGRYADKVSYVAGLAALYFLMRYGTFLRRKVIGTFAFLFQATLICGVLMKIMHWPFANETLFGSLILIGVTYLVHFLTKPIKTGLDVAKLVWMLATITVRIMAFAHLPFAFEAMLIHDLIFLVMFIWFTVEMVTREKKENDPPPPAPVS